MLILGLLWLLLYLLLSVLGAGVIHTVHRGRLVPVSQTETILTGLVSLVGVLQLASIFLPVNFWFVAGLVLLAVFINAQLANRPIRAAANSLRTAGRQPVVWLLVVVVVLYAVQRTNNPDSGTYHMPVIRYIERFSAIPGLGNLFSRLAFNSSYFVVGAAFAGTDLAGQTLFPLNGFLLLVFGGYVIRQLRRADQTPDLAGIQLSTLVLALFFMVRQVSSPTADVWATLLTLFVFLLWLDENPGNGGFRVFLLMALTVTCLTVKLATLPLLLVLPFLAYQHRQWFRWQHGAWGVALGCLLLGPWLARNVILSGYLIFPLTQPDLFAVDWKVAGNVAQYEQDIITHWARFHLNETDFDPKKLTWPFGRWVAWWWSHWWFWYNWPNRPMFVLAVLSPLLVVAQWIYVRTSRERLRELLPAYVVALGGFLFWFLKAPEFRFGYAFIWMTALLPVFARLRRPIPASFATGVVGLVLIGLLGYFMAGQLNGSLRPLAGNVLMPKALSRFDPEAKHIRYSVRQTRSGLAVVVPNAPNEPCFETEQPCTPFFFDDLELRGQTVASGFRRRQTHADSIAHSAVRLPLK